MIAMVFMSVLCLLTLVIGFGFSKIGVFVAKVFIPSPLLGHKCCFPGLMFFDELFEFHWALRGEVITFADVFGELEQLPALSSVVGEGF